MDEVMIKCYEASNAEYNSAISEMPGKYSIAGFNRSQMEELLKVFPIVVSCEAKLAIYFPLSNYIRQTAASMAGMTDMAAYENRHAEVRAKIEKYLVNFKAENGIQFVEESVLMNLSRQIRELPQTIDLKSAAVKAIYIQATLWFGAAIGESQFISLMGKTRGINEGAIRQAFGTTLVPLTAPAAVQAVGPQAAQGAAPAVKTPGQYAVSSGISLEDRIMVQRQNLSALQSMGVNVLGINLENGELQLEEGTPYKYRGDQTTTGLEARKVVAQNTIVSRPRFDANKTRIVYIMNHGFVAIPEELYNFLSEQLLASMYPGVTRAALSEEQAAALEQRIFESARIHDTFFAQSSSLIPGSIQYQMTGIHYQGENFDIKYTTEGRGIQYLVKFDKNNNIVDIKAQYMEPGSWSYALPGYMDIVINLGGLRFTDIPGGRLSQEAASRLGIETESEF
jgi:hypothetical protein